MNDPIPDLRFTPTSPEGEALPIIFAATTRPDGSPVITIELAWGESIAEVLPADRDRIMAALDRAIDAACWLVEEKPESDATANPREAVVVQCDDGWWQVRTRDRKQVMELEGMDPFERVRDCVQSVVSPTTADVEECAQRLSAQVRMAAKVLPTASRFVFLDVLAGELGRFADEVREETHDQGEPR